MKMSAVVWSVHKLIENGEMTQDRFVSFCSQMGLDGVDLFDNLVPGDGVERERNLAALQGLLEKGRMHLASYVVHTDFTRPAEHEKNDAIVERGIQGARRLGAGNIRILGGSTDCLDGRSRSEGLKSVTEGLQRAVGIAEKEDILLVLENHGDLPGRADEMLEIIHKINSPMLKLCFDMGNFIAGNMSVKQSSVLSLQKVIEHVRHVHVKDRRFKPGARGDVESCIAGTGAVPLYECMAVLHQQGYDGYIACECEGEQGISVLTSFRNSVANIKTAIEKTRQSRD